MLGLYVSTTRKHRFASVRPGMHCDMVNHSPDSPAKERGEGAVHRRRPGERCDDGECGGVAPRPTVVTPRVCGVSSTPRLFDSITGASDYWIARLRGR